MLLCCNRRFMGGYYYVLVNKSDFYRRIEFGICPKCGTYRFLDYRIINNQVKEKFLSGKCAYNTFKKIFKKMTEIKHGTKSNQNFYYGDYKVTSKKDFMGNPIYIQLRKNFNDETEVLGEVETKISYVT